MNKEKLQNHLDQLKERHLDLDKKIKEGYTHYLTDKNLNKIKFEKASVKREMSLVEEKLKGLQ